MKVNKGFVVGLFLLCLSAGDVLASEDTAPIVALYLDAVAHETYSEKKLDTPEAAATLKTEMLTRFAGLLQAAGMATDEAVLTGFTASGELAGKEKFPPLFQEGLSILSFSLRYLGWLSEGYDPIAKCRAEGMVERDLYRLLIVHLFTLEKVRHGREPGGLVGARIALDDAFGAYELPDMGGVAIPLAPIAQRHRAVSAHYKILSQLICGDILSVLVDFARRQGLQVLSVLRVLLGVAEYVGKKLTERFRLWGCPANEVATLIAGVMPYSFLFASQDFVFTGADKAALVNEGVAPRAYIRASMANEKLLMPQVRADIKRYADHLQAAAAAAGGEAFDFSSLVSLKEATSLFSRQILASLLEGTFQSFSLNAGLWEVFITPEAQALFKEFCGLA